MLKQFWNHLGITHKFSLIFIIMLVFIVLLCTLSYTLLTTAYRQTVTDIEISTRIQNLVMEMAADIEKARRIKHSFSLKYSKSNICFNPEDDFAVQVNAQLVKVSKLSETLKNMISHSRVSTALQKSNININLYYSIATRCNTVFKELMARVKQLTSDKNGLQSRLRDKATILQFKIEKTGDRDIISQWDQMQLNIKEYLLTRQRPFMQSARNNAFYLKKEIQEAPLIKDKQRTNLLSRLDGYTYIAMKIPQLDVMIQTRSRDFDLNTETLEPVSANLIQLARKEVERARSQNEHRVRLIGILFLMAALSGFLLVGFLAVVIHKTITRQIVRLTNYASELQSGHFDVQDRSENHDELGRLSESFNQMAFRLKTLINGLEQQVEERTKDLLDANVSLKKEITERRETEKAKNKLEAELRQVHKMEAIGTLAGGIAHDFNNILGIILGNCELAMDDISKRHPVRRKLEEINTASIRARDIVRQLLSFSRKTEQKKQPVKLQNLLKETILLLRSTMPSTIDIRTDIADNPKSVNADPSQLHQVIINLCTNAAHAMETDGGILAIHLGRAVDDDSYVQLTISDTGSGIDPEIIDKIFDPYFTTKEFGKGTGMGLSIVRGIITSHNGIISVDSEPQRGTTVKVLLPAVDKSPVLHTDKADIIPGGRESILMVDDEEAILETAQEILERLGYHVEIQTNPAAALKRVRSNAARYHLVITDMTMPGMSGADLARHILKIRPDLPIILCTGFSEKMNKDLSDLIGIRRYIEKPLNRKELSQVVRNTLDGQNELFIE